MRSPRWIQALCRKQRYGGSIPPRISNMLSPQQYIEDKLLYLKQTGSLTSLDGNVSENIFRVIMSKKYRKYSAPPDLQTSSGSGINFKQEIKLN